MVTSKSTTAEREQNEDDYLWGQTKVDNGDKHPCHRHLLCRGANSKDMTIAPLMLSRPFYGTHYHNLLNDLALWFLLIEH